MNKKISLKNIINTDYFEFKPTYLKRKFICSKFKFNTMKLEIKSPAIYICNKTTPHDKLLVANALFGNFVFLKDSIIQDLHKNKLTEKTRNEVLDNLKTLQKNNISVVIFPEKNISLFGKCENLPQSVTEFLVDSHYDLKFFYLIGTYIANPIWAHSLRTSETRYIQNQKLSNAVLLNRTAKERNLEINHLMPSSASVYMSKFETKLKSNQLAENIESLVYACPNCRKMFSLYSEFNCLKCRECGTLLEFSNDGKIMFSNSITTFDDFEDFLFNTLKNKEFSINTLVEYKNVCLLNYKVNNRHKNFTNTTLKIYADKFVLQNSEINKTINISDIADISLHHQNIVNISLTDETLTLKGKNKENFYIMIDLLKLYQGK